MVFDKLYLSNDILHSGLNASMVRNEMIQNNIANVDTPGYKKRVVEFEKDLENQLNSLKKNRASSFDGVSPTIRLERNSYRLDENNVDIDAEMVRLYQNATRYDTLVKSVKHNYEKINLVLK